MKLPQVQAPYFANGTVTSNQTFARNQLTTGLLPELLGFFLGAVTVAEEEAEVLAEEADGAGLTEAADPLGAGAVLPPTTSALAANSLIWKKDYDLQQCTSDCCVTTDQTIGRRLKARVFNIYIHRDHATRCSEILGWPSKNRVYSVMVKVQQRNPGSQRFVNICGPGTSRTS